MAGGLKLSILRDLFSDGFDYGVPLIVEYQPHSLWYETTLTIAANALRNRIRTDYHTYMHSPVEVKTDLERLGLDTAKLEEEDLFRIVDSYSVQIGAKPYKGKASGLYTESMDVTNWKYGQRDEMGKGVDESHKRRLHIDDNTALLLQYNSEAKLLEMMRTRARPYWIALELAMINAAPTGVASSGFYGQLELLCDGIIDLKSEEKGDLMEHFIRIRKMRGRSFDSRWRKIKLLDNGEISLAD